MRGFFDDIVTADEIGIKLGTGAFEFLKDKCGGRIVYVDDNPDYIQVGRQKGLESYHTREFARKAYEDGCKSMSLPCIGGLQEIRHVASLSGQ